MAAEIRSYGGNINEFYFCPYHEDAVIEKYKFKNHPDRKPNPGMLLRASKDYNIDLISSVLVGDNHTDIQAATSVGMKSLYFNGGNLHNTLRNWLIENMFISRG
jgi:D-glycero-D-manno-heptose 1,7-bisphosphate phosphatase